MRGAGRAGGVLLAVLALIGAALLSAYWVGAGAVGSGAGDPTSSAPNGAAAVAQVLRDHGNVELTPVGKAADLGDPGDATLVVGPVNRPSDEVVGLLRRAADRAASVVLVRPDGALLERLAPGVREAGSTEGVLTAGCDVAALTGLDIAAETRLYRAHSSEPTCFHQVGGGDLPGAVVVTRRGGRPVTVVGSSDLFSNQRLTSVDNAAVALRLLGAHPKVVWYTGVGEGAPDAADPGEAKPWPPAWLGPLTLALTGAVLGLMLWRGRRLGRLATEPLPVVVRADETSRARGRLYRHSREPAHAARVLQAATTARVARQLGLPADAGADVVAEAAAGAARRTAPDIHRDLTRTPASDRELLDVAQALTALEKEVRRS